MQDTIAAQLILLYTFTTNAMSCSLSYDTHSLTLKLTKKIQKPINRTIEFWKRLDGIHAFRSHIEMQTNTPPHNVLYHTPSEKVVEYVWQNIIPSISKLILLNIQFNTFSSGVAITQIHLNHLTINSDGYHTDITIDSVAVERITVHFTYSNAINGLDDTLETSRVVRENDKPFSYVNELKYTQGDNPLLNRNLHWKYIVTDSGEQIDQANIHVEDEHVDHKNVTYAQLKDNYGEGNIHIYLEH